MHNIFPRVRYLVFVAILALCGCDSEHPASAVAAPSAAMQSPASLPTPSYFSMPVKGQCCVIIAHAGGAIDGNSYSNSLEAVQTNYALGLRMFELDFQQTADGHWVAAHDWAAWKNTTKFPGTTPPDLSTFSQQKLRYNGQNWSIKAEYTPISLQWVNDFLLKHKDAVVVTDVKELQLLRSLVNTVLSLPTHTQFIFQAYSMDDVDWIKKKDPDARVILTLYRIGRPPGLFDAIAKRRDQLDGVTLPMNWAYEPATLDPLRATGLPLYLHGSPANINSRGVHAYFADKGVNGFYLD